MTTRVVHVNDEVPGAVYIGRAVPRRGLKASEWRNPYKVGKHGTRVEVIEKYRSYIETMIDPDLPNMSHAWMNGLRELAGKPLACWCRRDGEERTDDNACHGDILIQLIQELGLESDDPA